MTLFLLTLACTDGGPIGGDSGSATSDPAAHDNGFGPGACGGTAVTKFWDPEADDWVMAASGSLLSLQMTFECEDGQLAASRVAFWNGSEFETREDWSAETRWTWDGDRLQDQITTFWDGTDYVMTTGSTRVESAYDGDQLATQDTWHWDGEAWFLGYEDLGAWSQRLEYSWLDGAIASTTSKYWQGNVWDLEYTTVNGQSRKHDYIYEDGQLAHTTSLFYDGSAWYVGWESTCCVSWRTMHEWGSDGRLSATETRHWDDVSKGWIVGWEWAALVSVRTEFSWD